MRGTDPGSAREEAERLVAMALAMARLATSAGEGERFATGSAECCVCPVCRAIVALRDPSPEFAERLAAGAGDLAAGVASLLRSFSTDGAPRTPEPRKAPDAEAGAAERPEEERPEEERDVWAAATHAEAAPVDDGPDNRGERQR